SFNQFLGAIREADPRKDFVNAPLQDSAAQAVQMSLMPQILVGSELKIDALRLKHHSDLPPQARRFLRSVAAHDGRTPSARNHQRGKNPKQRSLPAAIRT